MYAIAFALILVGSSHATLGSVRDPSEAAVSMQARGGYPSSLYVPSSDEGSLIPVYGDDVTVLPAEKLAEEEPLQSRDLVLSYRVGSGPNLAAILVLVAVMALLIVFFLWLILSQSGQALGGRRMRPARTAAAKKVAINEEAPRSMDDPDELARAGSLMQAIIALLERALVETGWRPAGRDRSQTAREVLSRVSNADPRRAELERIVSMAEGLRFGGRPVTHDAFVRMKESVSELLNMDRGAG